MQGYPGGDEEMKKEDICQLFFCRNNDFLTVYIPKQRNGSQNTASTYKCGMKTFRSYVNDVMGIHTNKFKFSDCTYDFLLDYRNHLHDVMHLSESTCNNKLATVKSYMGYAAARDVSIQQYAFAIEQVPFYRVPKTHQPIIEDVDALGTVLKMPPNTHKGLRDKTIMAVLYDTGMRVDELVSLRIRDVTITDDCIKFKICGKGNKERISVLDAKTAALVRQYLSEFHPYMNPGDFLIYTEIKEARGAMTTRNVQKLIKKYADKARETHDLPDRVSPHTLRRTRGTLLYRDGVPLEAISRMLGHAGTQTTRDHYTAPSLAQMKELAAKKNEVIPEEEPIWSDDEDEMAKILGLG